MRPLLLALGTLLFLPALLAVDYEWYVSADGSDDADCGRNASNPCNSLTDILSTSSLFSNASATWYTSGGAVDGWNSTTVITVLQIVVSHQTKSVQVSQMSW